jgi:PAS domain S-box-containing protein
MTYESSSSAVAPETFYSNLFEAMPTSSLLLQANPPHYTIIAATPQHLKDGGMKKEDLIGKSLFEAYPTNPNDASSTGESDLRTSLDYVVRHKEAHQLPVQRYDVVDERGEFIERYWRAENKPVFSPTGEVEFILQTTEELTAQVIAAKRDVQVEGIEKAYHLFMQAPFVIGFVKGEKNILELMNESALKLWGKGPDVIGKPLLEAIPEGADQNFLQLINQVRTTGKTFTGREVAVTTLRSGVKEVRYFDLVYQPVYEDGQRAPVGVFTISHDVTALVESRLKIEHNQQELAKAHQRIIDILESTTDAFYSIDGAFNFTYINKRAAQLWKIDRESTIGKNYWDVFPQALGTESYRRHYEAQKEGIPVNYEILSPVLGIWIEVSILPTKGDGLSVFFRDISERKQVREELERKVEERTAALQRSQQDLMHQKELVDSVLTNTTSALLYCQSIRDEAGSICDFSVALANQMAAELSGYSDLDEFRRKTIKQIHKHANAEDVTPIYINIVETGVPTSFEYYMNAFERWYMINTVKVGDGFLTTCTDISKTKSLQLQYQDLVKELERSNVHLEEFAYAASHDLKEPVRKIRVFTNDLRKQLGPRLQGTEVRLFERVDNATQRMGTLIDDLLLYSHMSQKPLEMETVDLNTKIQLVLEDLELDIAEKHAVIHREALPIVKGYRRQLQQMFQNLISNALKYSKADVPPVITISASVVTEKEKSYHLITVKDNGIGFEQEYDERIFQIFTRLHGRHEYSGTGVGLSIVKKVVENHHGMIRAESTPGVGSIFKVFLPLI